MKISWQTIIIKYWWTIIVVIGLVLAIIWGINAWVAYRSPGALNYPISPEVKAAQELYATGKLAESQVAYQKVINNHPNDYVAINGLGNILRDQKDFVGAETMYLRAINIYNRYEFAYRNLLTIYQMWPNEEEKATKLQMFDEVIKKGLTAGPRSGNILGTAISYYKLIGDTNKVSELETRLSKLPLKSTTIE